MPVPRIKKLQRKEIALKEINKRLERVRWSSDVPLVRKLTQAKEYFQRRGEEKIAPFIKHEGKEFKVFFKAPSKETTVMTIKGFKGKAAVIYSGFVPRGTKVVEVQIKVNQKLPKTVRKEVALLAAIHFSGNARMQYGGRVKKMQMSIAKGEEWTDEAMATARSAGFKLIGEKKADYTDPQSPVFLVYQKKVM